MLMPDVSLSEIAEPAFSLPFDDQAFRGALYAVYTSATGAMKP